jgi:tetratricopeptide (TPR) repeat protein
VKLKPSITAVLVFIAVQTALYSQNTAFPRLQPDPKALEYYRLGVNGVYSWTDLARISLWASGDNTSANLEKIRAAVETLKNAVDLPDTFEGKAEYVLTFMYKNLLKSYSLNQTRIDTLLSTGRYNCVSSAVLYMILCESVGIRVNGVMTKDHAFISIPDGDNIIDVETTNAYGFDPGNRKEFHDQFGKLTGFTYVPAKNYRDRETISQIELVSLILNNRIADYERLNQFADSVPIAIDRAALLDGSELKVDPTIEIHRAIFTDPRIDLLDRLYNFGAMLLRAGKEEDCLRWAATASPIYPDEKRWQEFIMAAVNNNLTKLLKANKFTDARNFLDRQKPVLSQANFDKLDNIFTDSELAGRANQIRTADDGDSVVNAIDLARNSGKITEKRAVELITFAVQKAASSVSMQPAGNWRGAIKYIEASLSRFGSNRELEQAITVYRGNLATDYHNRFATEWNKKNFTEAQRVLNEGLAEFPKDRQLLNDKQIIDKQGR